MYAYFVFFSFLFFSFCQSFLLSNIKIQGKFNHFFLSNLHFWFCWLIFFLRRREEYTAYFYEMRFGEDAICLSILFFFSYFITTYFFSWISNYYKDHVLKWTDITDSYEKSQDSAKSVSFISYRIDVNTLYTSSFITSVSLYQPKSKIGQ